MSEPEWDETVIREAISETFSDRLQHLLKSQQLAVSQLAQQIGVSRQSCYKWLITNQISDENLMRIARYFDVSPEWLKFGVNGANTPDNQTTCSTCGLKQFFVEHSSAPTLCFELDPKRKSLQWTGNSASLLGIALEELPYSFCEFLEWIVEGYHAIFLAAFKRATLSGTKAQILIPISMHYNSDPVWLNCDLYVSCIDQPIWGFFTKAEIVVAEKSTL